MSPNQYLLIGVIVAIILVAAVVAGMTYMRTASSNNPQTSAKTSTSTMNYSTSSQSGVITVPPNNNSYSDVVSLMKNAIFPASINLEGIVGTPNNTFAKELLSPPTWNSITNGTMTINNVTYKYAIMYLYDSRYNLTFSPSQINVNGINAKLLSKTVQGNMTNFTYGVYVNNAQYETTFYLPKSFPQDVNNLSVSVHELGKGVYAVEIITETNQNNLVTTSPSTTPLPEYVTITWLILVQQ